MKNASTLFIFLFCFIGFLQSQITVTSDDLYNQFGIAYPITIDTLPDASILPGGVGTSTWDFSALQQHQSFTWTIELPEDTPFGVEYPNATFVINEEDTDWVYFEKTPDALNLLGLGQQDGGIDLIITYDPVQITNQFPINFNTAFSDVSKQILKVSGAAFGLPVDSIRSETTINRGVVVDAFGPMTLPGGTVEALRIETRRVSFDSTFTLNGGVWTLLDGAAEGDTTLQYNWVSNESGWDIPIVSMDGALDSTGTFIPNEVSWLIEPNISSTKNVAVKSFDLYPNPAADVLNIEFEEFVEGAVEIIDFNGKSIIQQSFENTSISINLESVPIGNFVLVFKNKDGALAGFKQFSVVR